MHSTLEIQPYHATSDAAAVAALWQEALGQTWPLSETMCRQILAGPRARQDTQHFVARLYGRLVGFAGSGLYRPTETASRDGYLSALVVAPQVQRQGIGMALHETALAHLRARGARRIQLGGGLVRFWPGVPSNLPAALAFFQAQGWRYTETTFDLWRDLRAYVTPPALRQRMAAVPVWLSAARAEEWPELLAFQERAFPFWSESYAEAAALGDYADALLARTTGGQLVGSLLMITPRSHPERTDAPWTMVLGPRLGGLGAVGVAQAQRGHGIGLALVARGSELLRERGADYGYIGWTRLTDFYGQAGYTIWREYQMSWRP